MCCGNSLFSKADTSKKIKFSCDASGASLSVLNGATTIAKVSLCDFTKVYTQYNTNQLFINAGSETEIPYNIGTSVNFLFIKVQYVPKNQTSQFSPFTNTSEVPFMEYRFESNLSEKRYMDDIMILTGSDTKPLGKILLKNPNLRFDANVTILASAEKITYNNIVSTSNVEPNQIINIVDVNSIDVNYNSTSGDAYAYLNILNNVIEIDNIGTEFIFDAKNSGLLFDTITELGVSKPYTIANVNFNIKLISINPYKINISKIN